jgi:hypothetical protein
VSRFESSKTLETHYGYNEFQSGSAKEPLFFARFAIAGYTPIRTGVLFAKKISQRFLPVA